MAILIAVSDRLDVGIDGNGSPFDCFALFKCQLALFGEYFFPVCGVEEWMSFDLSCALWACPYSLHRVTL